MVLALLLQFADIFVGYDILQSSSTQLTMNKDEMVSELNVCLTDLFLKWTKGCKTVEQLGDFMILEQLVNALQTKVRVRVMERKSKTSAKAAKLRTIVCAKAEESWLGQERKFNQKASVDGKKNTVSESESKLGSESKGEDAL